MSIKNKKKSGYSRFLRIPILFFVCLLIGILDIGSALAADLSAYQAEMPVTSYSATDWQKTIMPALNQVLVNVSGDKHITQNERIRKAITNPSVLVQSYHYVEHADPKSLAVQIQFSPKAVDKIIQKSGHLTVDSSKAVPSEENDKETVLAGKNVVPQKNIQTSSADISEATQSINLVVAGIMQLQDYTELVDYLRHIVGVNDVNSQQTKGDRVLLILKINISQSTLVQILDHDGKLVKAPIPNANNPAVASLLSYRWANNQLLATPTNPINPTDAGLPALSETQPAASASPQYSDSKSSDNHLSTESSGDQMLVPGDSKKAPILEGAPTKSSNVNAASTAKTAVGQAQTFGASNADSFSSDSNARP